MDYLFLVRVVNGIADWLKKFKPLDDCKLVTIAEGVKRLTFDVLHDEIGESIVRRSTIQQTSDVRVIERSENLSFFAKTAQDEIRVHSSLDEFYCSSLVEFIVG